MDSWEESDGTRVPIKVALNSNLNLEDISDEDYSHAQKLWEAFEIKNLDECHNLYAQSDTLLLADVSENFRNMCLEIYGFCIFCVCTRISMASLFKKDKIKIRINNTLWHAIDDWKGH